MRLEGLLEVRKEWFKASCQVIVQLSDEKYIVRAKVRVSSFTEAFVDVLEDACQDLKLE